MTEKTPKILFSFALIFFSFFLTFILKFCLLHHSEWRKLLGRTYCFDNFNCTIPNPYTHWKYSLSFKIDAFRFIPFIFLCFYLCSFIVLVFLFPDIYSLWRYANGCERLGFYVTAFPILCIKIQNRLRFTFSLQQNFASFLVSILELEFKPTAD